MKIAIASVVVVLLCGCIALGIYNMPTKREWADDYRQYASTLANDDPLRQTLDPMLADGELSIWEISRIYCGEAYGCRLNNFTEVLINPQSADLVAQTVLASLKHKKLVGSPDR